MDRKTIRAGLRVQQKIEGYTSETALLLKVLPLTQYQSEWSAMTTQRQHSYGKLSYETHHFYYPSELLTKLVNLDEIES